jgi:hypothetical protein
MMGASGAGTAAAGAQLLSEGAILQPSKPGSATQQR